MELKKLDSSFYAANPELNQALDFDMKTRTWSAGKVRGHGIVQIEIKGLVFAIPVRSTIHHNECLILEVNRGHDKKNKGMGLDYSKAVLIRSSQHVSADVFVLKSKEAGKKLIGKEEHITKQFTKYVERYIKAYHKKDMNILRGDGYRYTTLINYHVELGL